MYWVVKKFQLINPKKQAKSKKYVNSGQIILSSVQTRQLYSFVDYVVGGLENI